MKPHPRLRRLALWGGAVGTVVLAVAWAVSMRFHAYVHSLDTALGIGRGSLGLSRGLVVVQGWGAWYGPRAPGQDAEVLGRFEAETYSNGWHVVVPLWPPAVLGLAVTLTSWRFTTLARHRERFRKCQKCRYNRAGLLPTAVCPECGTAPRASAEPV